MTVYIASPESVKPEQPRWFEYPTSTGRLYLRQRIDFSGLKGELDGNKLFHVLMAPGYVSALHLSPEWGLA